MGPTDDVDARLRAIREATEGLAPRPGFQVRLDRRIAGRGSPTPLALIAGRARPLLAASLLVTAAAAWLAWTAQRGLAEAVAQATVTEALR